VDNIRQIKDEVLFPPNGGRYKIYIIDEVHMLSNSAFNALLKTIEEPPPYIVFIFATTELHKVPATIKSRCQQFAFRLIPVDTVKKLLSGIAAELGIVAEDEALLWIAKESGGSLRDAYTLFDQVLSFSEGGIRADLIREKLGLVGLDRLNALFGFCLDGSPTRALEALDSILDHGVSVEQCVIDLVEYSRSLLLLKCGILRESLLGAPASAYDPSVLRGFSAENFERALALFMEVYRNIRYTVEPRFELELAVSRLCRLADFVSPSELARSVHAMRKYLSGEGLRPSGDSVSGQREERVPAEPAGPGIVREEAEDAGGSVAAGESAGGDAPVWKSAPQACETFGEGIDPDILRAEVIAELGKASPILKSGLAASGLWCIEDGRLVIPFQVMGIDQKMVKDSIGILAESVSRHLGRSLKVELRIGKPEIPAQDTRSEVAKSELRSAAQSPGESVLPHYSAPGRGELPADGAAPSLGEDEIDPVRVVENVFRGTRVAQTARPADSKVGKP
jgi:DNA polymerase III subunit gamma/tau